MSTDEELENSVRRIHALVDGLGNPPMMNDSVVSQVRSLANYLDGPTTGLADRMHKFLHPAVPPVTLPGQLNTQLDGLTLPGRPSYNIAMAREWLYGLVLNNQNRFGGEIMGAKSSCIKASGNCIVEDVLAAVSNADAIKVMNGNFIGRRGHSHSLGLIAGAHADGCQIEGNVNSLLFEDWFFDQPTNLGDGSRSNASLIISSQSGANGDGVLRRCILHGGNLTVMIGDKDTGNRMMHLDAESVALIVGFNTPRYGLLSNPYQIDFDDNSAVYYRHENGICEELERGNANIKAFNHLEWHKAMFDGEEPAK